MDTRLARLIADYQAAVREVIDAMQRSGLQLPASNDDWAGNDIEQRGELAGGIPYFKHGYGCAARLPSGIAVDFDFGDNGEIDGVEAWRLAGFAGSRLRDYGFDDESALIACFKAAVERDELVYSGYILYYLKRS